MATSSDYDPRYLAGILFFNAHDFFEAHEVWEDLWTESHGDDRRFVQGLIQVAVGLFHFGNGNTRGARRLYHSSKEYMSGLAQRHMGLDVHAFWEQMQRCCADLLPGLEASPHVRLEPGLIPVLTLDPPPDQWPDPESFLEHEDDQT